MKIVIVTGTDTGVGKTIATAALALRAAVAGSVAVVKPTQTGTSAPEATDAEVIHQLTGLPAQTWISLPEPLAPATAARRSGSPLPTIKQTADRIRTLDADCVIVEGAGGLLVQLDAQGGTIADLAADLGRTHHVEVVVVTRLALGTLNHTALTLEALSTRDIAAAGIIIGSLPEHLGLAEHCNLEDLQSLGAPVIAQLPEGAGRLSREAFATSWRSWFAHPPSAPKVSP